MDIEMWIILVIGVTISDWFFYYKGFSDGKEYIRDFYEDDYENGFAHGKKAGIEEEAIKFKQLVSAIEEVGTSKKSAKKVAKKSK